MLTCALNRNLSRLEKVLKAKIKNKKQAGKATRLNFTFFELYNSRAGNSRKTILSTFQLLLV